MKPWSMTMIAMMGTLIITMPSFFAVHFFATQQKTKTDYYLSIRVENVSLKQVPNHVRNVEKEYGFQCEWITPMIQKAHADFPEGTVFFFNTSDKHWKALGGEIGYAIILNGRIAWRQRIKRS